MAEDFWPPDEAFLDVSAATQPTDGRAHCVRLALCNGQGEPTRAFERWATAHFFYEFEILAEIRIPRAELVFHDAGGRVIHVANTAHSASDVPIVATPGTRLRYHHVLELDLSPGDYPFTLGLLSSGERPCVGDLGDPRHYHRTSRQIHEHCLLMNVGSFSVTGRPEKAPETARSEADSQEQLPTNSPSQQLLHEISSLRAELEDKERAIALLEDIAAERLQLVTQLDSQLGEVQLELERKERVILDIQAAADERLQLIVQLDAQLELARSELARKESELRDIQNAAEQRLRLVHELSEQLDALTAEPKNEEA